MTWGASGVTGLYFSFDPSDSEKNRLQSGSFLIHENSRSMHTIQPVLQRTTEQSSTTNFASLEHELTDCLAHGDIEGASKLSHELHRKITLTEARILLAHLG